MSSMNGSAAPPTFAYLVGSDHQPELILKAGDPIRNVGSTDTWLLRTRDPQNYTTLHVTPGFFDQHIRYATERYSCLVNLVTDPDQNPRVLRNLVQMLDRYRGRVINPPSRVLQTTRDQVARTLAGIPGLRVPATLRLFVRTAEEAASLQVPDAIFPAILRPAGTHSGRIVGVIKNAGELRSQLQPRVPYYLTQFVDFRSPDGLYRKYRFFFIGRTIVFRHLLASDAWNIHAADRTRFMANSPDIMAEEKALYANGREAFREETHRTLVAIGQRMGLDYFGLDCAIAPSGEVTLFECNPTMNFFPFVEDPRFDYVKACLAPAQQAYDRLLYGEDQDKVARTAA